MKITVTVKPRSKEEKVQKIGEEYVISVKEPAIENKANKALIKLLSRYFHVPETRIEILSGKNSRRKIVEIKMNLRSS